MTRRVRATTDESAPPTCHTARRLLDRQGPFGQSRGRWNVHHISRDTARLFCLLPEGQRRRMPLYKLMWNSWFYSLAYQRTVTMICILFVIYTAIVVVFAGLFWGVSVLGEEEHVNPDGTTSHTPFCSMDIHTLMEALYFSLSTMATIGYGVQDYYFGGCWTPLLLVLAQVITAIIFNAIAVGVLFQRISRGHNRSKTIVLSDRAVIRRVRGQLHLQFRIGELRHHYLLEATVRAYVIGHERCFVEGSDGVTRMETTHFVTKPLVLLHQAVSPHILMSVPQVLVHRLDDSSPLRPHESWCDAHGMWHAVDATVSTSTNTSHEQQQSTWAQEVASCRDYWQDRALEVVVLVEGTDELTGATIQTRHSYTYANIAWNCKFQPCVLRPSSTTTIMDTTTLPMTTMESTEASTSTATTIERSNDPSWLRPTNAATACIVDYALFHEIEPAPLDCTADPYVPIY
jgi:hypothetical protein